VLNTVTVPAPGDPYSTPTTFYQNQLVGIDPGSPWETALGANITALSGNVLNNMLTGSDPNATANA
jgi:hypothetical protein